MGPKPLMQVLHHLPDIKDENLLVGMDTADDAGVYKITPDIALVNTVDFFPPIVDDPYMFGSIAAANSLSDIYAMGGTPKIAMNIVCFPPDLDLSILDEIIRGSIDKLKEAGVLLIGGHSIEDKEIKYGLSVTGLAHPDKIVRNAGAKTGDILILTKPIGVGIIATALKNRNIRPEDAAPAIRTMQTLNNIPARVMMETGVNAATDVTGFGLIGHAAEMADASNVSFIINSKKVPHFAVALKLLKKRGNKPKSISANREYFKERVVCSGGVSQALEDLLYDPQTSGGLLLSASEGNFLDLLEGLKSHGVEGHKIGEVVPRQNGWLIYIK